MALSFTTPEEALCAGLIHAKGDSQHLAQPHVNFASLPSPETPLSIQSFPIEIHSETSVFRPKNIANLWTQLLSIQIQNGNFWNHEDAVALHKERTPAPPPTRDEIKAAENTSLQKGVLYLRHKIQKGLLIKDQTPIEAELPEISKFISKLESFGDLDASIILSTKIHKVCKSILNLESIPGDDTYQFKARSEALYERYSKILETARAETPDIFSPTLAQPKPEQRKQYEAEELTEVPDMCLTQLTHEQCARIKEAAKACNPPLDCGVVELMCILPHFTAKYRTTNRQVAPLAKLVQQTFNWLSDDGPKIERGIWRSGPIIPPHMHQLTTWVSSGSYGIALFVDTQTGEGIQLKSFGPLDKNVVCTEWEGPRRPIEELLQEWIDLFLTGKLVPSASEDILSDGFRSMDVLKQKFLLQEFGWPSTFPLSPSDYQSLIKRQSDLYKERLDRWDNRRGLDLQWSDMNHAWHTTHESWKNGAETQEVERFKALDGAIKAALEHHVRKFEDREYALAADVPLDTRYAGPVHLSASSHIGSNWRVDVTPQMIIERFSEVAEPRTSAGVADADIKKMKVILDKAYERWELNQKGIYSPDDVCEEDDDETSDYEPSEEECSEEEEFESDEEDEDLDFDVVMLEEDVKTDVEDLRRRLEGAHTSGA
ncbi:hypothetical protein BDZ45DRAFT_724723 [Acephala macrosclerotiorum]|nr:hypothetical protein BDZ45DRAFT_724723 [Acephala macrosclerotiorum]